MFQPPTAPDVQVRISEEIARGDLRVVCDISRTQINLIGHQVLTDAWQHATRNLYHAVIQHLETKVDELLVKMEPEIEAALKKVLKTEVTRQVADEVKNRLDDLLEEIV